MSETAQKKDIQKLQRAIVDGLEDVKAHDIRVFNTEHLSPLFERVVVATGNSNRQTKAIAASVRDKVREAGFPKPRTEGEENGEWIIVDCGAAVAHVMQPTIRQYYNLEEIWGDKPVRLKGPATAGKQAPRKTATASAAGRTAPAKKAPAKKAAVKAPASKTAAKTAAKTAPKVPVKKAVTSVATASPATKKAAAKKVSAKTAAAKTAVAKGAAGKTVAKKAAAKKAASKKIASSNAPARKAASTKA